MLMKLIKNSLFSFIFIFILFFGFNKVNALGNPFSPTGTLDFNIITKDSDNQYFTATQTRNYDFSLLLEQHASDFENYRYFFITLTAIHNNSWGTNKYVLELYFSNNARAQYGQYSDTFTGNFQRYVYDTNYVFTSNAIFDASNTLTATQQIQSSTRTGIMVYAYYKRVPFYGMINSNMNVFPNSASYMNTDNFLDSTNIPLLNNSYSSPVYYIPIVGPTNGARCLLFSNYSGTVAGYSSTSGAYTTSYTYEPFLGGSSDNGLDYEDLNSSGSIEEVEFTHNNITFTHLLKIKISDLFRSDNSGYYKPYFLTYMSSFSTGVESNFYITYDKTTNGKPNFPLSILFKENLGAIEKIANGTEEDPFSFEYYGNRLPECSIESSIPLSHTTYNDSPNFYNYLLIYPTWYCGYYGDTWEPTLWGNDYIYIYYNARLYNDLDTLEQDFEDNPSNFEETNFFNYMVRSLDHFMGRIVSIFKIITIFFNSLPYEIRLMFIAVFTLIITLLIYKVIG